MKNIVARISTAVLIYVCASCCFAQTATVADDSRGFSYFLGLGRQDITYKESPSILPAKTKVDTSSPLLIVGGVYAVTTDILLTLDTQSTFAANTTTETWRATSNTFGGTALTSDVLQKNDFKLQQSNTQVSGYYRLQGHWFAMTGATFHSQTFKRFAFTAGPDNATNIPANQVIEESSSELLWQLGMALESEQLRGSASHYGVRLYAAKPVWREVDNTALPDKTFHGSGGYDVTLEGRYSYAVLSNAQIGGWAQYAYSKRNGEIISINNGANHAELPDSTLTGFAYGLELLWKL